MIYPFTCSKPKILVRNYLLAKVILVDIEAGENVLVYVYKRVYS